MGLCKLVVVVDELIICFLCLKNFGLYCECIGVCLIIVKDVVIVDIFNFVLLSVVCSIYLMLFVYGVDIVSMILGSIEFM